MAPEALRALAAASHPDLLKNGSAAQRAAASAIKRLGALETLAAYTPIIAGSFPLDLQTETSDIDVLATATDLPAFLEVARGVFGERTAFRGRLTRINAVESVVVNFSYGGYAFEIFAQARSVREQDGCLHLLAEYRLLQLADLRFFEAVRALRIAGKKTEPAFCAALGVSDDPYAYLRELAVQADEVLLRALERSESSGKRPP